MVHISSLSSTTILLAALQAVMSGGSFPTKKVKIHVPHSIQHHHHTHTKYHFITVPVVRPVNKTEATPSPQTPVIMPVMPVMPIPPNMMPDMGNMTTRALVPSTTQQPPPPQQQPALPNQPNFIQPNQPQQPDFRQFQPQQPNFQQFQPQQPNFQQFQPQQPNFQQFQAQQPNFQQPNQPDFQQFQPQQPNSQQVPRQEPFNSDYEYIDRNNRRSREKIIRADSPIPPMKFKTIINVQETKKIPLMELFDLRNLLQNDPPRRVKVDVFPDKTSHVKQPQKFMDEWHALQDSIKSNPYPGLIMEDLEYDPETAAFQSRHEPTVEKPEWVTLKKLLEKHIHEDFPGLKVKADVRAFDGSSHTKDHFDGSRKSAADTSEAHGMDLTHIGYIVIGDNNEKRFVGLNDASQT